MLAVGGALAVVMASTITACGGSAEPVHAGAGTHGALDIRYHAVSSWDTGYTGQYTITNDGTTAVSGWTLAFMLPVGTSLASLWDGSYTHTGGQVSVTNESWDATISPGRSVSVGFVTKSSGQLGQPADCTINGASCQGRGASPSGISGSAPAAPGISSGTPSAGASHFAPYADATLYPLFPLVSTARRTGVKQFNLAFVVAGGGNSCTPEWGGVTAIGEDPVAAQIGALRAIGGDVRISFGGEDGSELAQTCTTVSQLEGAYQRVISAYDVNKVDFDVEGAAIADTAANTRRSQALAALQARDKALQVSFTLPALPSGLTSQGVAVLTGAVRAGVRISAVNVMAMDYGDGVAPHPSSMMGTYAIDAATAADAQVARVLGISDHAAWPKIAVTPMIGVNDISDEIFTVANARQLTAFAISKHLAWLSMWSAGRDQSCPGGAQSAMEPTCSSIVQTPDAYMDEFGSY
jgi:Cellulose binding domain